MAPTSSKVMCFAHKETPVQSIVHCSRAQDLPVELIDLVFSEAEPEPWWIDWRSGLVRKNIIWIGARVCARWRHVILGNRRLWCGSSMNFLLADRPGRWELNRPLVSDVFFESRMNYLLADRPGRQLRGPLVSQTLFSRSAGLPIDVSFDFSRFHQEEPLDTILEVSARCSSLHLTLPLSLYACFVTKSSKFPILRRLSINTSATHSDIPPRNRPRIVWEKFPLLEELSLTWNMHEVGPLPSSHRLKKINMAITDRYGSISLVDVCHLLHGSTTLRDVRLRVEGAFSRMPDIQSITIAPKVENLKLESKGTYVLRHMTFPALRALSMTPPPRYDTWFGMHPDDIIDHLVAFLGRSACPLEEFSWTTTIPPPLAMPRVLPSMPHLKFLKLSVHHHNPHYPQRLVSVAELFFRPLRKDGQREYACCAFP
ncbi:hypothetical protein BDZ89DRAFT_811962 [Hymenopellis radicata]|nr:hypothetical protein BDZ89DRAFT_811962 [Hymenopellis radicata]